MLFINQKLTVMKKNHVILILLTPLFLVITTCQKESNLDLVKPVTDDPIFIDLPVKINSSMLKSASTYYPVVYKAEYITTGEGGEIGRTIYFSDRGNKQLGEDFVPFLSFLTDGTTDITYYIDENRATEDVPVAVSSAAIQRAMSTWDNVRCSDLGMTQVPYDGRHAGLLADYFGFDGSWDYIADIVHCGWLPCEFWNSIMPDFCDYILAIVFTIVWADENGELVDSDNNNKWDVAWREVYYNEDDLWGDGERYPKYDIETVALHEAGHGLSQAHFGEAFRTISNDKLHFSPRAVMNAGYTGIQTELFPIDLGGHCSLWANWPNHNYKNFKKN